MSLQFADKLYVLNNAGLGLLCRVHYQVKDFELPKEVKDGIEPVLNHFEKNFPEYDKGTDKLKGYDMFKERITKVKKVLEPFFMTFLDLSEWVTPALDLLVDIHRNSSEILWKDAPDILTEYMDLFLTFCKLHVLIDHVKMARAYIASYAKAAALHSNTCEDFEPVSQFILNLKHPISTTRDKLQNAGIHERLQMVMADIAPIIFKWNSLEMLHKDKLNVGDHPLDMTYPTDLEKDHLELQWLSSFHEWTVWSYLMCPIIFADQSRTPETIVLQLTQALEENYALVVFRDVLMNPHKEINDLVEKFTTQVAGQKKKFALKKFKKPIKELQVDHEKTLNKRASRRAILSNEMQTQISFFKAFPQCLSPKYEMIIAMLSLARWEVETYFHLQVVEPYKSKKFEFKCDPYITYLIRWIQEFKDLIFGYSDAIKAYHVEYLNYADVEFFENAKSTYFDTLGNKLDDEKKGIFESVLNDIKTGTATSNFSAARLNAYRLSISSLNQLSGLPSQSAAIISGPLTALVRHTRAVDSIIDHVGRKASLKALYYFKTNFESVTQQTLYPDKWQLPHVGQVRNIMNLVRVPADAFDNLHKQGTEDHQSFGKTVTKISDSVILKATRALELKVVEIAHEAIALREAAGPDGVIKKMRESSRTKLPGAESQWAARDRIAKYNTLRKEMTELVASFSNAGAIHIFYYDLFPLEYLVEAVERMVKKAIRNCISSGSTSSMQRPSKALANFSTYVAAIQSVGDYCEIDVNLIVKKVLCTEFSDLTAGDVGDLVTPANIAAVPKEDETCITTICKWFQIEFDSENGLSSQGIAYSPTLRAFVQMGEHNLQMGNYTDPNELDALCTLIGPSGVRCVERSMLHILEKHTEIIGKVLEMNTQLGVFENIQGLGGTEYGHWEELMLKLQDMDKFLDSSIKVGCVLKFRQLLSAALKRTLKRDMPFLQNTVGLLLENIPPIQKATEQYQNIHCLGSDFGFHSGEADSNLYALMTKHAKGAHWKHLPVAYGISFCTQRWKEAQFSVRIDGHLNNAHMIVEAIKTYINGFARVTFPDPVRADKVIQVSFLQFLHEASSTLLNMMNNHKTPMRNIRNMMVILEHFVQSTPRLELSELDNCFPYTLLRTNYVALYEAEDSSNAYGAEEDLIAKGEEKEKLEPAKGNVAEENDELTSAT